MMVVLVSIDIPFCLWYGGTLNPNHSTNFVSDFIYLIKLMVYYSDRFFGFTGGFLKHPVQLSAACSILYIHPFLC